MALRDRALVGIVACLLLAGGCSVFTREPANDDAPAWMWLGGGAGRPISLEEITKFKVGTGWEESREMLTGIGYFLCSVPVIYCDAAEGGLYGMWFIDLENLGGPSDLKAVIYYPPSGAEYYVIPSDRRGDPVEWGKQAEDE